MSAWPEDHHTFQIAYIVQGSPLTFVMVQRHTASPFCLYSWTCADEQRLIA
jgi:hypothetical protein